MIGDQCDSPQSEPLSQCLEFCTTTPAIIKQNMDKTFINSLNKLAAIINKTFSKKILGMLQQRQPQKEHELGPTIYSLGTDLSFMGVRTKSLIKLEKLASLFSKVHQSDGKNLVWALKPAMLALVQHNYLKHPYIGVKLLVAYYLNGIIMLTAPIPPYSDDKMRSIQSNSRDLSGFG